ncbi:MAG: hypothetical protein AAFO29_15515 [Actinomycetota bacterium]
MTTRRQFILGASAAVAAVGGIGLGGLALTERSPTAAVGSPSVERVRTALESTVGHRFDPGQLEPFVDHLRAEHPWVLSPEADADTAARHICTQFILTSSLAVNGVDPSDYQFFGAEITCSPFARFG